jgi:hypothetical protein
MIQNENYNFVGKSFVQRYLKDQEGGGNYSKWNIREQSMRTLARLLLLTVCELVRFATRNVHVNFGLY